MLFLIDTAQTVSKDIESDGSSLGSSFDTCIQQYSGLPVKKRAEVFVA